MPRKKRLISPTGIYHIVARGNNKQNIFIETEDYLFFIGRLSKYLKQTGIKIYSYCLMTNHIHLLISEKDASKPKLSIFMKKLCVSYAYYFNTKYERSGHLFQDRFRSEPIISSLQFTKTVRYILQNPIKAGLSKSYEYKWNSFKDSISKHSNLINCEGLFQEFGTQENYIDFISQFSSEKCLDNDNYSHKSDRNCITYIKNKYSILNPLSICHINIKKRNNIIKRLIKENYSIRQISRITGMSRGEIKRIV